ADTEPLCRGRSSAPPFAHQSAADTSHAIPPLAGGSFVGESASDLPTSSSARAPAHRERKPSLLSPARNGIRWESSSPPLQNAVGHAPDSWPGSPAAVAEHYAITRHTFEWAAPVPWRVFATDRSGSRRHAAGP